MKRIKCLTKMQIAIAIFVSLTSASSAHTRDMVAPDKPDASDIVVIGNKKKTDIYKDVIAQQFKVRGGGRFAGQYAKFIAPICPSAGGFSEKHNKAVEDRIREVATQADIAVAPFNCVPNLSVIAVESGPDAIRELRKKRRGVFATLSAYERNKLINGTGPVYSWKTIGRLSTGSGADAKGGRISIIAGKGSVGAIAVGGQRSHVKSKLIQSTFEGISQSYLLIETAKLKGITPKQLGDYAAMVSLIDIQPENDGPPLPDSILTLFDSTDSGTRPASIAVADLVLLSALYKAPRSLKASGQRSAILHSIKKQLDGDEKDTEQAQ